jgi:hypothetical protein
MSDGTKNIRTPEGAAKEVARRGLSGVDLSSAVQFWPTPTAHIAKEGGYPAEHTRNTPTLSARAGGKLNPRWVEWLMGFPDNHTDLSNSETP